MKRRGASALVLRTVVLVAMLAYLLTAAVWAQKPVYVLTVEGTVDQGLSAYVCRGVSQANAEAQGVLVEINTFGGRVDAATEARDCLLAADVPVATYVTKRAWSSGALIALAGRELAMAPGSSMGAAEPRPKEAKTVSALRGEFEATAERFERDPLIAAAMVDARVEIAGLVERGELLTLRAGEAQRLGFAQVVAPTRNEVLEAVFPGAYPLVVHPNWGERAARLLTDPAMSTVLLIVTFLGLIVELLTPGLGLPGLLAAIALGLFFGGRLVVGLVGWEVIFLFASGFALLSVEVFALPGFGVVGVLGLLAIFGSLFLAYGDPTVALRSLSVTVVATVVIGGLLVRRLAKRGGRFARLVLSTRQVPREGYVAVQAVSELEGEEGVALTSLRPAGLVELDGRRIDAVSEGSLIAAGSRVKVVRSEGLRVVVRRID